jgi:hypothetical protein
VLRLPDKVSIKEFIEHISGHIRVYKRNYSGSPSTRLSKEEVAAGYEASGRGFNNALGRLRTLELVQGRGELRASDNLFEQGLKIA